jgi:hypothetical protein
MFYKQHFLKLFLILFTFAAMSCAGKRSPETSALSEVPSSEVKTTSTQAPVADIAPAPKEVPPFTADQPSRPLTRKRGGHRGAKAPVAQAEAPKVMEQTTEQAPIASAPQETTPQEKQESSISKTGFFQGKKVFLWIALAIGLLAGCIFALKKFQQNP